MTYVRSDYIADGYIEDGYIAPVEGLHGMLRFQYRPVLPEEQVILFALMDSMKPEAYKRKCGHEMAERLSLWSLLDEKSKPVAIEPRTVLGVRPSMLNRLFGIITGIEPTDIDPDWPDDVADNATEDEYESAITEQTPGAARADRHAGN